jgi:DNA-binding NarL/FixJ family response regulator
MYDMRRTFSEPNAVNAPRAKAASPQPPRLTARETAVLGAVALGESNREIGRRLGIGEQTVKNHVSVLIQKFHVRNRVQLAVLVALDMPELLHRVT